MSTKFAKYKEVIYKVSKIGDNTVRLVSSNEQDIQKGFVKKENPDNYLNKEKLPDLYICEVDFSCIKELYEISDIVLYKEKEFEYIDETKELLKIGTINTEIAKELKFERTDKYLYEKWVPESEIEIMEERKNIPLN
ncbi:hypothetical protein FZ084_09510 [Listeria monocytogenes]|uniref:hypothetical protein n=1 Tax=Listeria monocytogenes TaxID=1639 RepID=UPI0011EB7C3E|nr:hypothetical protein [Listeria monocytogenes]EAV9826844.1 hypothetical protein [Listeria monocytogenes]TYW27379.1 hypothetical protein FZ084_09510 [Listeria monocytogenes]